MNGMKLSLSTKMAAVYLVVLACAIGLLGGLIYRWTSDDLITERRIRLLTEARIAADASSPHLDDHYRLSAVLEDYGRRFGSRLLVTEPEGRVLGDSLQHSRPDEAMTGQKLKIDEVQAAAELASEQTAIYRLGDDQFALYAAVPLMRAGEVTGVLLASASVADIVQALSQLTGRLLLAGAGISAVFLVVTWLVARGLISPLAKLQRTAARLGSGALDARVEGIDTGDEVHRLAETFNQMAEEIEAHDRSQRQFISDASHELRTPISSAMLLVEALQGDESAPGPLLNRLSEQLDRMSRLIDQLLELARLDEARTSAPAESSFPPEPTDLGSVLRRIRRRLQPVADEKDVQMAVSTDAKLLVGGPEESLERVVQNLAENAVKYTPAGGSVQLDAVECGDKVLLQISDTGPGIPPEQLQNIFDRFWRGDPSRSRPGGGFGLGLSIVRRRVEELGGQIDVESHTGEGSCFTVTLPRYQQ